MIKILSWKPIITCGILQTSFLLISLIKSSVKLSDTQRNKCRVSIITWSSEMKLNKGVSLQLNFFDLANLEISSNDVAPWELLESDHTLLICLWLWGHLHQMHAYSWLAPPNPQTQVGNFQSPPRNYLML